MKKFTLYLGLNDKETKLQKIQTVEAFKIVSNLIAARFDGGTIFEADGVYKHENGVLVIVKTLPGLAHGVASTIDSLNVSCTLGTIDGDDTIMIVCRNEHFAASIVQLLENLAK